MTQIHSQDGEEYAIGAALVDRHCLTKLIEVPEHYFHVPNLRLTHRAILSLFQDGLDVDLFTVSQWLETRHSDAHSDWMGYCNELAESTPATSQFDSYISTLADYAKRRDLAQLAQNLEMQLANGGDTDAILEAFQDGVIQASSQNSKESMVTWQKTLEAGLVEIERRHDANGAIMGQTTGYSELDETFDGFNDGVFYVLAGRPSMGKSAFALQLVYRLAKEGGRPWIFFSLEMTNKAIGMRAISNHTGIPSSNLKGRPRLQDGDFVKMGAQVPRAMNKPIFVDETPGLAMAQIRARCKIMEIKHGQLGGIVIDHAGKVKPPNNARGATEGQTAISNAMAELPKEFNCPLIGLVQINRTSETTKDGRPTMAHLKQSGAFEEDARAIMLVYRDEYYNKDTQYPNTTEIIIPKNSEGEVKTIAFSHNLATGTYEPLINWTPPEPEPLKRKGADL